LRELFHDVFDTTMVPKHKQPQRCTSFMLTEPPPEDFPEWAIVNEEEEKQEEEREEQEEEREEREEE
ncbi:11475_t:CDS:1, partial [Dentiscutata erythropus]